MSIYFSLTHKSTTNFRKRRKRGRIKVVKTVIRPLAPIIKLHYSYIELIIKNMFCIIVAKDIIYFSHVIHVVKESFVILDLRLAPLDLTES